MLHVLGRSQTHTCLPGAFSFLILATYVFKESVNKSFIKVRNAVASLNAFVQSISPVCRWYRLLLQNPGAGKIQIDQQAASQRQYQSYIRLSVSSRWWNWCRHCLLVCWYGGQPGSHLICRRRKRRMLAVSSLLLFFVSTFIPAARVIADKFTVLQMGMIAKKGSLKYSIMRM